MCACVHAAAPSVAAWLQRGLGDPGGGDPGRAADRVRIVRDRLPRPVARSRRRQAAQHHQPDPHTDAGLQERGGRPEVRLSPPLRLTDPNPTPTQMQGFKNEVAVLRYASVPPRLPDPDPTPTQMQGFKNEVAVLRYASVPPRASLTLTRPPHRCRASRMRWPSWGTPQSPPTPPWP